MQTGREWCSRRGTRLENEWSRNYFSICRKVWWSSQVSALLHEALEIQYLPTRRYLLLLMMYHPCGHHASGLKALCVPNLAHRVLAGMSCRQCVIRNELPLSSLGALAVLIPLFSTSCWAQTSLSRPSCCPVGTYCRGMDFPPLSFSDCNQQSGWEPTVLLCKRF